MELYEYTLIILALLSPWDVDYNPEASVTSSGYDISTTDFTTDGRTTSAFETTTADVSSMTDSSDTTVDMTTSTAVQTTTTFSDRDTTTAAMTTTIFSDRDTTTAARTTTTSLDRDTTSAARSTTTSLDRDTTTAARTTTEDTTHTDQTESTFSETASTLRTDDLSSTDFSTTTVPIETTTTEGTSTDDATTSAILTGCILITTTCTDMGVKDDVRNYVIMALSIVLGIQTIGIIVWCVWSRVKRTYKVVPSQEETGLEKKLVSTATQTGIFFPETFYRRPLPPIDTQLEVVSEGISKDIKLPDKLFGNHLEIFSEKNATEDHEKAFPEEKRLFEADEKVEYSDLPRSNFAIPEDPRSSADSEEGLDKTPSNSNVMSGSSLNQETTDVSSVISEFIEIPYEDSPVPLNALSGDKNKYEFKIEDSASQVDSVSFDEGVSNNVFGENEIKFEGNDNVEERLFIRRNNAVVDVEYPVVVLERSNNLRHDDNDGQYSGGILQRTRHPSLEGLEHPSVARQPKREGGEYTGLENKKTTFQIKRWHDEEDVEKVITLEEPESATSNKRHVSFKDTHEQKLNHVEEIDNNATLFGPGFRGLQNTQTKYVDKSTKDVKTTQHRKRSLKRKPSRVTDTKILTSPYLFQKRYSSIHGIIAKELFKGERYEDRVRKNLMTSSARRGKRYKRNSSSKSEVSSDETKPLVNTEA